MRKRPFEGGGSKSNISDLDFSGGHFRVDLSFRPLSDDATDFNDRLERDLLQAAPQLLVVEDELDRAVGIAENKKFLEPGIGT